MLLPHAEPQAGEALLPPLDIFKIAGDGHPTWVQSSLTLDDANARIQSLVELSEALSPQR